MKPEDFVQKVRQSIIDENMVIYKDLFENTSIEKVNDPYWKEALGFFKDLSDENKRVLFNIMRQTSIDTTSNLFAILDGVAYLEGQKGSLSLISNDEESEILNGSLQDILLEFEE